MVEMENPLENFGVSLPYFKGALPRRHLGNSMFDPDAADET
jgi:hypothetical protein